MKTLILTITATGVVAGLCFYAKPRTTKALSTDFARTYAWLGDQYQKAGQLDNAKQVWQRGAAFFPDAAELQKKLAAQP